MGNLSTSQVDRLWKRAFLSRSPAETKKIAASLAHKLLRRGPIGRRATVLGLVGDLGAGKTTFIQGFAQGLGIKHHITSPTFVIFRNYKIPRHKFPPKADPPQAEMVNGYKFFYHVDAYRIKKINELPSLGFKKILADPKNILLVEWAENIKKSLPRGTVYIRFSHSGKVGERKNWDKKTRLIDITKLHGLILGAFWCTGNFKGVFKSTDFT